MLVGDQYQSRTNNDTLTIYRVGLETVSASSRTKFAVLREDCTRDVFNALYVFTGNNALLKKRSNDKTMIMGDR